MTCCAILIGEFNKLGGVIAALAMEGKRIVKMRIGRSFFIGEIYYLV
jgi:hypothetical protein